MPKPLFMYKNPSNIPAINRTVNASWVNGSAPIKWNKENKIADKIKAKNCEEKLLIDLNINFINW